MIVTLDAYSGRPNPSWRLSDKDNARLLERVAGRSLQAESEATAVSQLGPRGFVIEASRDDEVPQGLPMGFRVGAPTGSVGPGAQAAAFSRTESQEIARFLLNTGRHVLDEDLMAFLDQAIAQIADAQASADGMLSMLPAEPAPEEPEESGTYEADMTRPGVEAAVACIIANTPYNPGFWNTPAVQPKNNCYNYAMNWRSDTFAQPGRISGHIWTAINCANVGTAANWDGCRTTCSGSNKNVALVIAPGPGFVDYHWYRRHSQGFWGHKPGGTAARNTDNRGRVINGSTLTPANCDRGPYTIFCGYRFSPTGTRVS
jgi:hypothetical protein